MTDCPDNSNRPEPLPTDYDAELRRVDEMIVDLARHERALTAPPVDLLERVFEASAGELGRSDERSMAPPTRAHVLPLTPRGLAAAAGVALLLTATALLLLLPGRPHQTEPLALEKSLPERLLQEGLMPLIEGLESDYDRRITRTEIAVERLASDDIWVGTPAWGHIESELIVRVEGW